VLTTNEGTKEDDNRPVRIERSILIERPFAEVFGFVADPRNDPRWCPKVDSVEQIEGEAPGPVEDDGVDRFEVTYALEEHAGGTRLTQRSDARLGAPKLLHPIWRRGIQRDIDRQLRALKGLLESGS
jgi:Polyketide cyclase / dehydrase and lipid transport